VLRHAIFNGQVVDSRTTMPSSGSTGHCQDWRSGMRRTSAYPGVWAARVAIPIIRRQEAVLLIERHLPFLPLPARLLLS
jgi:hypothetical protein